MSVLFVVFKRGQVSGMVAGVLVALSARLLWLDYLGLENYLARLQAGWVSSAVTTPLALAGLVLAGLLVFTYPRRHLERFFKLLTDYEDHGAEGGDP